MNKHKIREEVLRRLRAQDFEVRGDGSIAVPAVGLSFAGFWETSVNGGAWQIDPNIVTNEGMLHILDVALDQGTANSAFYIAPFSGNVTPGATWTAANFTSNSTEFTNYDEATRVLWANDAAASNAIVNNTTPALFTIGSGGGTVRGAGLISVSTKSATTGKLIAAARFSADKTLAEDEELRIKYTISATSS